MRRTLGMLAVMAILVVALGTIYGRWVAAESRARVAEIEAQKNERITELNTELEVLRRAAAERRIEVDTFEQVRIREVDRATGFLGEARFLGAAMTEHLEARGDTAGARMFGIYKEQRDGAFLAIEAGLFAEMSRTSAALSGWDLSKRETEKEIEKREAVERANRDLHGEIETLQGKLSPSFMTQLLRTGRDVGIGVGIGYLAGKL